MENERQENTPQDERTPLTFQMAECMCETDASAGVTAQYSGGTTGGGGYGEDANIDYD
ncbi:MAG: hypothetical protein ABIH67_02590 [Candidatus Uhrbacteria bacterium]